jgi:hypothetical protein
MEITNLVRPAAAEIITITTLRPGDVYSRLEKQSYSETWYMILGVVQTIHHNGTDAAFTAFEVNGQTMAVKHAVYGTSASLSLFTASPDEVHAVLASARESAASDYESAKRSLEKAKSLVDLVDGVIMGAAEITTPLSVTGASL